MGIQLYNVQNCQMTLFVYKKNVNFYPVIIEICIPILFKFLNLNV